MTAERQDEITIHHDAERLAIFEAGGTHREARVVRESRAASHENGIMHRAEHLHAVIGRFAGDHQSRGRAKRAQPHATINRFPATFPASPSAGFRSPAKYARGWRSWPRGSLGDADFDGDTGCGQALDRFAPAAKGLGSRAPITTTRATPAVRMTSVQEGPKSGWLRCEQGSSVT